MSGDKPAYYAYCARENREHRYFLMCLADTQQEAVQNGQKFGNASDMRFLLITDEKGNRYHFFRKGEDDEWHAEKVTNCNDIKRKIER